MLGGKWPTLAGLVWDVHVHTTTHVFKEMMHNLVSLHMGGHSGVPSSADAILPPPFCFCRAKEAAKGLVGGLMGGFANMVNHAAEATGIGV